MEVIILAGGLGTRLRSVVSEVPKCMAPVCDKPFLYYQLKYIAKFKEITHVILAVGYLREVIFDWLNGQHNFPFEISYSVEESPLGTAGGIKQALSKLKGKEAIILNGDTFFDVDLSKLCSIGASYSQPITIALKKMNNFDRYGIVEVNDSDEILRFKEKEFCEEGFINGGIYYINLNKIEINKIPNKGSFEKDVLEQNVEAKILKGYKSDGYFIDIGIPQDYYKANIDFRCIP